MPKKDVKLRGELEGVTVELDEGRQITKVTKNGKRLVCRPSHSGGQVCKLVDDTIDFPGSGPVLQLHLSKTRKSLFARMDPEGAGSLETVMTQETASKRGFQRHAF